VNYSHL